MCDTMNTSVIFIFINLNKYEKDEKKSLISIILYNIKSDDYTCYTGNYHAVIAVSMIDIHWSTEYQNVLTFVQIWTYNCQFQLPGNTNNSKRQLVQIPLY